jgi:DNA replication licensing factor MCM5
MCRSTIATEEHVTEALRLFHVSTMDAAQSGITANLIVSPEMRAEIQVIPAFLKKISTSFLCFSGTDEE